VCMTLLEFKANPLELDTEGVTPVHYASCSEACWPVFAAAGCERVSKPELVSKGVLRKASSALEAQLALEAQQAREMNEEPGRRGLVQEYT
ncbi:unnamed protein product, partial [Prorocentrum cordatum]